MSSRAVQEPRRRIGLKPPITGLVLIGLVAYGTYWGWDRAFGDTTVEEIVSSGCPTPSGSTPGSTSTGTPSVPSTSVAAQPAAGEEATPADPGVASAVLALGRLTLHLGATSVVAATTPAPAPTATPTGPAFVQPAQVMINVINATGRRGLAANTAAVLRDRGFTVDRIDNAPADDLVAAVAQIRAATAESPQARLLVQHVPGAVLIADGRPDATVDLVLGDAFSALGDPTLVTPVPLPTTAC